MKLELTDLSSNGEGEYKYSFSKRSEVDSHSKRMVENYHLKNEIDFSVQPFDGEFEIILYNLNAAKTFLKVVGES